MDRLICGDVGFGKTEVALRAAFLVAMSGQAGGGRSRRPPCCARQHFKHLHRAFRTAWPIKVRHLSRLCDRSRRPAQTRDDLANGTIATWSIGTHALLAKNTVSFKRIWA